MLELGVALVIAIGLNVYLLLGGADYGGGVWDLFASGGRAERQRDLIARSIGPIWEANHVWLIVVVVVLFTGFPAAFARIMTFLHIPLLLMLLGIVARGSAFAFRSYETSEPLRRRWGSVFAIASLLTPILLGTVVGAIASGNIISGTPNVYTIRMFIYGWLGLFPLSVGFFALVMMAFLASVYLCLEARETDLQEDFRARALISGVLLGGMAVVVLVAAAFEAPEIVEDLIRTRWSWALHSVTAVLAISCLWCLWTRRYRTARLLAAMQVTLIMWGWAFSLYPHLVKPDLSIYEAAAPRLTLELLLIVLALGSVILLPSLYYLFRVFHKVGGPGNAEHPNAKRGMRNAE
ncbi:MAG: cytochrome d ubiquinol oxidase subunit II [Acidobacteria bacterium]|nr:MAG: cytochrome d ubiquinol oxidase subunit II [Acidobacteriota bacterium]